MVPKKQKASKHTVTSKDQVTPATTSKAGVLNSIYLRAARGRVWVRLGRIKFSAKQSKSPRKPLGVSLADRQVG